MRLETQVSIIATLARAGLDNKTIRKVILKARRYQALQVSECNRGMTPKEEVEVKNIETWLAAITPVGHLFQIQDDPRGACVSFNGVGIR